MVLHGNSLCGGGIDMEVIIKNTTLQPQIPGFGQITSTLLLMINVKGTVNPEESRQFILSMKLTINSITYYFSNIFSMESIDSEGNIIVGEITVIGYVDPVHPDMIVEARIIYLDSPAS